MSKRALKKYLKELDKEDLEEQIMDLYERLDEVKVFYNFVFNPNERKLIENAKVKIGKEYFPENRRKRPKARRSIAQKLIKHFKKLGVDPIKTADLMLYNIEIAQTFAEDRSKIKDAFYKSMFKSYEEAVKFILQNGLATDFESRIIKIALHTETQDWPNSYLFLKVSSQFD
ncbi:DUF6155 family protein [Zunongwangia endophytica]|uniref:DUF6155 family protein n=1 Tax=Zunongwangia endophytica TaxID=1808945 RepID=A0ABV8HCP0_9FLAO|nr:DUF6155 family protein [Zunongwangia endophytica]MDN3594077.1 DUF6155 family protein [Zunongwangia endophytica]